MLMVGVMMLPVSGVSAALTLGTASVASDGALTLDVASTLTLGGATTDVLTLQGTVSGASPLVFEGATADDFETTIAVTDPTTDRMITIPNATTTLTGTDTTDTLSNKTLTAPKFADLGFLADANGSEILIFDSSTSAVNELTIGNAATGSGPVITASGSDANISIEVAPKGTGQVTVVSSTAEETGAIVRLLHRSVSPAADDIVGTLTFSGKDSGGNDQHYALIRTEIITTTNGSEAGRLVLAPSGANGVTTMLQEDGGGTGPQLFLSHASASPLATDHVMRIVAEGKDSAGDDVQYARIVTAILDTTDTNEDGEVRIEVAEAGTQSTTILDIDGADGLRMNAHRFQGAAATVASASNLTLTKGNVFTISGTTTINCLTAANWQAGSVVMLKFSANISVQHDGVCTGAIPPMLLQASPANANAFTANDTLTIMFDGTQWLEVARTTI